MRGNITKVVLLIVVTLWLLNLAKHRGTDSVLEDERNIFQNQTEIGDKTQGGQTCRQNASASNITGFDSFPSHLKDFLYYRHCRRFPLLLDPPGKCGRAHWSGEVFLLLVIKSSPGNFNRREVLRKTWAKERQINGLWIRRVFISGATGEGSERIRLNKLLKLEQQEHHDIIQWDFKDTHCNLTLKQALLLEWLCKNCPQASFVLNGDDDVFAHIENMVEYLQSLDDGGGSRHLFAGLVRVNDQPVRNRHIKYFVPREIHQSDLYPQYCSGGGILLSRYTALVMYRVSLSIPLYPMDDVYLGMILAKAGLNLTSHVGFKLLGINVPSNNMDRLDPCLYRDLMVVHRFLPEELYIMWHTVHDPDVKCFSRK